MSFSQFRISSDILRGLKDANVENPTPLQKKIIKAIKEGRDLLIKSDGNDSPETAYLVPVLDYIARQERRQGTKTLVLTPYPERVEKLESWIRTVGVKAGIGSIVITEQGEKDAQKSIMSSGPTAIVATPGRLAELMEENRVVLREVQHLILDSADAFEKTDALQVIMQRIIGKYQRIISVIEADEESLEGLEKLLTDPFRIGFEDTEKAASLSGDGKVKAGGKADVDVEAKADVDVDVEVPGDLTQYYIRVPPRMKISTLIAHLDQTPSDKVIIFAASSRTADRLYRVLRKSGRRAASIHDGLNKNTLEERLGRFTGNDVQHLVVGGISAGELNAGPVTQVVNYDVPEETAEYKLRADILGDGRKARIVSLVSKQDRSDIHEIIENLGYAPEEVPLPEEVRKKNVKTQPKEKKPAKAKESARAKQPAKNKQPARSKGSSIQGKKQAGRGSGKPQQRPGSRPDSSDMEPGSVGELPRPSFDKLSGGRSGRKGEEKSWIKRVFKNLFS